MTQTERDRLVALETKVDAVATRVTSIETKVDTLIDKLDNKYAGKWTEKVIVGLITVGATATTTFLLLIVNGVIDL